MDGWLKLHRSVLDCKQFANPYELKIWVWMLCKASITDRYISLKVGKGLQSISLKRGQLIFGRNKAESELKIDASTIYRIIQRFQEDGAIIIESNNQYSIITITHFNNFQDSTIDEDFDIIEDVTSNEQAMNNQRTTNEQPMSRERTANEQQTNSKRTHNKKVNKVKKADTVLEGLEGEKKPAVENGFSCFVDYYFSWFKERNGGAPVFNGRDGEGIKTIASFMRDQAKERNPGKSDEEIKKMSLEGYKWVLSKWDLLPPYLQQKISPGKMATEINEIFNFLNNKKNGNGVAKNGKIESSHVKTMFDEIDSRYGSAAGF